MKKFAISRWLRGCTLIFLLPRLGNRFRIHVWRRMGAKIGKRCRIRSFSFSPESYLIELGDDVVIGANTHLITHEGAVCIFHREDPFIDLFGRITVGDNTFIGMNSLILPNTTIGRNCVIGAGSVVKGIIPDNSVAIGNPAKVVMKSDQYKTKVYSNPMLYEYRRLTEAEKKEVLLERAKTASQRIVSMKKTKA